MALDVPVPDPPSLSGTQPLGEYEAIGSPADDPSADVRREAIADALAGGAWAAAFDEWTAETDISTAEFELLVRLGLFDAFDFFWDPATDDVGYRAPDLPDEARREFPGREADDVEDELDTLGRIVSEVLENAYLHSEGETFGFADEANYEFRDED